MSGVLLGEINPSLNMRDMNLAGQIPINTNLVSGLCQKKRYFPHEINGPNDDTKYQRYSKADDYKNNSNYNSNTPSSTKYPKDCKHM